MAQDTNIIKEKVISTLKIKGPSLPIHIAKEIEQPMLFASAFLSELISEKKIKMSHMRVGSSPVYYLREQIADLSKFSEYLKSKEKEAFKMLKENRFLEDEILQPAIRVALREIKDFAIPFKKNEKIYWRYFIIPESEFSPQKEIEEKTSKGESPIPEVKENKLEEIFVKEEPKTEIIQESKEKEILEEKEEPKPIKKKPIKKKTTASQKKNEKFFEKIKVYLDSKQIQITNIIGFTKTDLTLRIKEEEKDLLLIAFNKKRVDEKEIIKCLLKAEEYDLPYKIFVLGEQTKKMTNLVEAIKNLDKIETIE